jgi:hypothetical protein
MEGRKTARNSHKTGFTCSVQEFEGLCHVVVAGEGHPVDFSHIPSGVRFNRLRERNLCRQSGKQLLLAPQRSAKRPRSEGSRYSSSPDLSVDKIPARLFQGELTQMPRAPNVEKNEKTDIVIAAEYSGRTLLPGTSVTIHLGSNIATSRPPIAQGR